MSYKDKKKIKRKLKKISFDFDKAHLAYTSSDAPACSLVDEPIMLKSLEEGKELSIEQQSLLEAMGYDIESVAKSMDKLNTPSLSSSEGGEGGDKLSKTKEGLNKNMSDEILKEMAQLRKALAVSKIEKELTKYSLSAELEKELSEALAEVEGKESVFKAFDAIIAAGEAKLEKSMEEAKEAHATELEKAKAEGGESELAKTLEKEAGEGGKPEGEVEKSRTERVAKHLDKNKEGK